MSETKQRYEEGEHGCRHGVDWVDTSSPHLLDGVRDRPTVSLQEVGRR